MLSNLVISLETIFVLKKILIKKHSYYTLIRKPFGFMKCFFFFFFVSLFNMYSLHEHLPISKPFLFGDVYGDIFNNFHYL